MGVSRNSRSQYARASGAGSAFFFRNAPDDVLVWNSIVGRLSVESTATRLFGRFIRQHRNDYSSQPAYFNLFVFSVQREWRIRFFAFRSFFWLLQLEPE